MKNLMLTSLLLTAVFGCSDSNEVALPEISTTEISTITQTTAVSGGTVISNGGEPITMRGVCWSTSDNPTIADSNTNDGSGTGSFSSELTGLIEETVYNVRAYATNATGATGYGNQVRFKTTGQMTVTMTDGDGNIYASVQIGDQIWTTSNLRTITFNDGTSIPFVADNDTWGSLTTPGYSWAKNDEGAELVSYGALYNLFAVDTDKLCGEGWHVPSYEEWVTLRDFLGGAEVAGGKMKEVGISNWTSPNTGASNESGFSALPSGLRYTDGTYRNVRLLGYWWGATESSSKDVRGSVQYDNTNFDVVEGEFGGNNSPNFGLCVRCIMD